MSSRALSNVPIGLIAGAGLLLSTGPITAQVQSQMLQVQARIGETCTVTSATLDFGQSLDTQAITDAEGSIEIDCQSQTELAVGLSGGSPRFMSNGSQSFIEYQIFQNATRTTPWIEGSPVPATITGSGSVPVYGRVPVQTNGQPTGLYTDQVQITLVF